MQELKLRDALGFAEALHKAVCSLEPAEGLDVEECKVRFQEVADLCRNRGLPPSTGKTLRLHVMPFAQLLAPNLQHCNIPGFSICSPPNVMFPLAHLFLKYYGILSSSEQIPSQVPSGNSVWNLPGLDCFETKHRTSD